MSEVAVKPSAGCIICGGTAGSREHVFPAAFGGRRENKGIYCGPHNKQFGLHVAALLEQLDVFNAAIGVRPDRHAEVRPAPVAGPDGNTYLMAQGRIELAPPPDIAAEYEGFDQSRDQKFASQRSASQWMTRQGKNGVTVKTKPAGPTRTQFFTEPAKASRTLGEPPFMRALLYFGVTFLAHRFPRLARAPGLEAAKLELQSEAKELVVPVEWQRPEVLRQLPPNPFRFGHTVAISIDGATGAADALVSLWGAIHFGMRLGVVPATKTALAISYIDPLADRAPNDLRELMEDGPALALGSHEEGVAYLRGVVTGAIPYPMQAMLDEASASQLRATASAMLDELKAAHARPAIERRGALHDCVAKQSQRVLSQFKLGMQSVRKATPELPSELLDALDGLHAADPAGPRGISQLAEVALHLGVTFLAHEFERRLDEGSLDVDAVAGLLAGREGTQFLFENVGGHVLRGFFRED